MPQLVTRRINDIPFRFELEKGISDDGSHLKGLFIEPGQHENALLNETLGICNEFGGGFYNVYISALPDKGDTMEGAALSLMDEFCKYLKSSHHPIEFREMYRNMDIPGVGDSVDAVEFWMWIIVFPT